MTQVLINGIDNRISQLLAKFMIEDCSPTQQIFQQVVYDYNRQDISSLSRPGIFVFPLNSNKNSLAYNQNGNVCMRIYASINLVRSDLSQWLQDVANWIQVLNINGDFEKYLRQNNVYGLRWFGKICTVDYKLMQTATPYVEVKFDYQIDLSAYVRETQRSGRGLEFPDKVIYDLAEQLNMNVEPIGDNNE